MMHSADVTNFIKRWEGLKLVPSGDPLVLGVTDVGYGHVLRPDEERRTITLEEADELLNWDLYVDGEAMEEAVETELSQNQFDALLAFTFNLGVGALKRSTLLKLVNRRNFDAAADEFGKWVNAGGREVWGLVKRRAAERAIFTDADYTGKP